MASRKVPPAKTATREEIDAAVAALSDVDLVRLERFARQRIALIGPAADLRDEQELLREAYQLTYAGDRSWNKDVTLLVHLFGIIRSVSSHWAEQFAGELKRGRDRISQDHDTRTDSDFRAVADGRPDAERALIGRDLLARVREAFADDPVASNIIAGWDEGLDGHETRKLLDLDQHAYEAKVRAIRRRLEAEGFKKGRRT
jgi:hypothetical protein